MQNASFSKMNILTLEILNTFLDKLLSLVVSQPRIFGDHGYHASYKDQVYLADRGDNEFLNII